MKLIMIMKWVVAQEMYFFKKYFFMISCISLTSPFIGDCRVKQPHIFIYRKLSHKKFVASYGSLFSCLQEVLYSTNLG